MKYPFIVTVYRKQGTPRPAIQQYNFEDIGVAHSEMVGRIASDRTVLKVVLSIMLKEVNFWHRNNGREL